MTVAKNKALNFFSTYKRRGELAERYHDNEITGEDLDSDDTDASLQLLVACCALDISHINRLMLTLHIVGGFGYHEIASGLMMQAETVRKAIYRSKKLLSQSHQTFQYDLKLEQVEIILKVLYLMFNEGYKSTKDKKGIQKDICFESMRLTLLVRQSFEHYKDVNALLALMFFHSARFDARIDEEGFWLNLEEQDRTNWDGRLIQEGMYYLKCAQSSQQMTPLYAEALIASCHATAATFHETPWENIVKIYRFLEKTAPSVMVTMNRVIAESHHAPRMDLISELDQLKNLPDDKQYILLAAKAHLHRQMHQYSAAAEYYSKAAQSAVLKQDKQWLEKKAIEMGRMKKI
jgi:predicted RNA polymerase sigma factor